MEKKENKCSFSIRKSLKWKFFSIFVGETKRILKD